MLKGAGCRKKSKSHRGSNQPEFAEQHRAPSAEQQEPSIEQQQEQTNEQQQSSSTQQQVASTEQRPLLEAVVLENLFSEAAQLEYYFQYLLAQILEQEPPVEPEVVPDIEDTLPGVGALTNTTGPFALAPGQPKPSIYSLSVGNLSVRSADASQNPSQTFQSKSQLLPQYHPRLFSGVRNFSRILQAKITHSEAFGRVRTSSTINTNIDYRPLNISREVEKQEKFTSYILFDKVYEIKTPDKVDYGHRPDINMSFLFICSTHNIPMHVCGCILKHLNNPVKRHLDKIFSKQAPADEAEDLASPAQDEDRIPMLGLPPHHLEPTVDDLSDEADEDSDHSSSTKLKTPLDEASTSKQAERVVSPGMRSKRSRAKPKSRKSKRQDSEVGTSKKAEQTFFSKEGSTVSNKRDFKIEVCQASSSKEVGSIASPEKLRTSSPSTSKIGVPQLQVGKERTSNQAEIATPPEKHSRPIPEQSKARPLQLQLGQISTSKKEVESIISSREHATVSPASYQDRAPQQDQVFEASTSQQAESSKPHEKQITSSTAISKDTIPYLQPGEASASNKAESTILPERESRIPKPKFTLSPRKEITTSVVRSKYCFEQLLAVTREEAERTIPSEKSSTSCIGKSENSQSRPLHIGQPLASKKSDITSAKSQDCILQHQVTETSIVHSPQLQVSETSTSKKGESQLSPGTPRTTTPSKSRQYAPQIQVSEPITSVQAKSVTPSGEPSTNIPENTKNPSSKIDSLVHETSTSKKDEIIISEAKHSTPFTFQFEVEDSATDIQFMEDIKFEDLMKMLSLENLNCEDDPSAGFFSEFFHEEMEKYREVSISDLTAEQQEIFENRTCDAHRLWLWSRLRGTDCPPSRRNLNFNAEFRVTRPRPRPLDDILRLFGVVPFVIMADHRWHVERMLKLKKDLKPSFDSSIKHGLIRALVNAHESTLANSLLYLTRLLKLSTSERSLYTYQALMDDVSADEISLHVTHRYAINVLNDAKTNLKPLVNLARLYNGVYIGSECLRNKGAHDFSKITDATLKFLTSKFDYVGHLQGQRRIDQNIHNQPEQNPLVEPGEDQPPQNEPSGQAAPPARPPVQLVQPTEPRPSTSRSTAASHETGPVQPLRPCGQPGPSTSSSTAVESSQKTKDDRKVGMGLSKKAQKRSRKRAKEAQTTTSEESRPDDAMKQTQDRPIVKETESSASTSRPDDTSQENAERLPGEQPKEAEENREVVQEAEIAAAVLPSPPRQVAANQNVVAPAPRPGPCFAIRRVGSAPYRRDIDPSWPIELPNHRLKSSRFKVKLRDILLGNDPTFEIKLFKKTYDDPEDDDHNDRN